MTSLSRLGKQLGSLGDKLSLKTSPFRRANSTRGPAEDGRQGQPGAATAGAAPGGQPSQDEAEAVLNELAPGYFDPPEQFDALEHELRQLPINFECSHLEAVAEERTGVLDVVSEKLSHHVLQNYDKFVAGVDEVTTVEQNLQQAHVTAKQARERLALALREISGNLKIARDTRRKQGLSALLEVLLKLQQANNLQRALKEAQEEGQYAEAFWLCAQCIKSMEELGDGLRVVQHLTISINRLYAETTDRLEAALAAVCSDFLPAHYTRVLEGYMFLGNVAQLGEEVKSAFIATINSSVAKVVRGVLLTRPGFEDKATVTTSLQELMRYLPSDLFRTCLARVLMVVFDILVSHSHMVRWHTAALERHRAELAALTAARSALAESLSCGGGSSGGAGGNIAAAVQGSRSSSGSLAHLQQQQAQQGLQGGGDSGDWDAEVAVTGRAVMALQVQLQRGTASELEEVEARVSDEQEWGTVLQAVQNGLLSGRQLIWDEAARRIGILLSSPAAFEGEHFLQVMEWTQRILAAGEAFSGGAPCTSLRTLLERQSGKFFRLYHHSNIEALNSMLDKELWKRLPAELPSLVEALRTRTTSDGCETSAGGAAAGSGALGTPGSAASSLAAAGGAADFEQFVVQGNPWRKQLSPRGRRRRGPGGSRRQQLGFGGSAGVDDSRGAQQLEVDEYGVPRANSSTPASGDVSLVGSRSASMQSEATIEGTMDEPDDVFGDFIDEDTQQVRISSSGDPSDPMNGIGRRGSASGDGLPAVTNSSWRMYKWMRDYAQLMRPLRSASPSIFVGICELFEVYMLHIFATFSDVSITQLQAAAAAAAQHQQQQQQHGSSGIGNSSMAQLSASGSGAGGGGADALTPRLRATLLRISGESVGKYQQLFASQPGSRLGRALQASSQQAAAAAAAAAASAKAPAASGASQYFRRTQPPPAAHTTSPAAVSGVGLPAGAPGGPSSTAAAAAAAAAGVPSAVEISVVSNAGNLYGLVERTAAVESLLAVGGQLQLARGALAQVLPVSEGPALDSFYSRTVGAAEDLRDSVIRTGARLLLPLRWVPDRVGGANYVLSEPPTGHAAWVDELGKQLDLFRDRLAQVPSLSESAVGQLWSAVAALVAEACLEGVARCKKCSLEGRAAMSLDLQGVGRHLSRLLPPGTPVNLRLVDNYIKAFYLPLTELSHWAQMHPEYTHQQVLALTACIAESSGLKKRDKAALLAQVENELRALSLGAMGS